MGSAGVPVWTPPFIFCLRDGQFISGISAHGISGSVAHGSAGKRRLIRAGRSASRISNTYVILTLAGAGSLPLTKQNKPTWVSLVVHPGLPCWSPSEQSYPPLGRPRSRNLRNCLDSLALPGWFLSEQPAPARELLGLQSSLSPISCVNSGDSV